VSEAMVKSMKPGSVIVDLATPMGGNCPLTEKNKVVVKHGVTIIGHTNLAGHVATDASALFSRNLLNFITLVYDKDAGKIDLSKDEEISKAITLMIDGKAVHDILSSKPMPKTIKKTVTANRKVPEQKKAVKAKKTTSVKKKTPSKNTKKAVK